MACEKKRYETKKEAKHWRKFMKTVQRRELTNIYYCDECSGYHITSRPMQWSRDWTRHLKKKG